MKDAMLRALKEVNRIFGEEIFTDGSRFRGAVADIVGSMDLSASEASRIRHLTNLAVSEMKIYVRLKTAKANNEYFAVYNLLSEMKAGFAVEDETSQIVVECFLELIGFKLELTLQKKPEVVAVAPLQNATLHLPVPQKPHNQSFKELFKKGMGLVSERVVTVIDTNPIELLLSAAGQGLQKVHSYVDTLTANRHDDSAPSTYAAPTPKRLEAYIPPKGSAVETDGEAAHDLAVKYVQGKGVPKNLALAAKWFLKAAEQGHGDSQFKIGVMFETGSGVNKNLNNALKWYRKAQKQGHPKSGKRITGVVRKIIDTNQT